MVIFLNFILLQSLQVSFCYAVEHWNKEIGRFFCGADALTRKIMIVLVTWGHMKGPLISIKYFPSFILIYQYIVAIAACSHCSELNYGIL